ncbi:MAG: hypothetical protein KJN64_01980 [Ignavibacteria bacterium]|nr:hypothetical protein [Ignavibacteria bacterium]MBT8383332.1 hypothetical protein [Ignavibacteria bacterium]MBT8391404.1 hypothetical protein [Ignavibacteria bacterium]NNJ52418.1 hypothetical protein [Ignavibacteriaceae bacterium]NNL19842.1 hypothetical protein [Ignavibacteriaceae bacterium]
MKLLLSLVLIFFAFAGAQTNISKYEKAMKKNLTKINETNDVTSMLNIANSFERIAFAEKDKWLPYYYTSFMYVLAGFADTTAEKTDSYLDKADLFINIADSLQESDSEIYTLKGMIAQARMQVDPMNRWMKYGAESTKNFNTAMKLDTLNPRPEYLKGIGLYYTPKQFGGGPKTAKPLFEKSLEKYNQFQPENDLMPDWGRDIVEQLLEQINKDLIDENLKPGE